MSAKPRHHTLTTTFDDVILLEYVHWHDGGETFQIFELSGEILADILYQYLDKYGVYGYVHTIPPYPRKKEEKPE